MIDRLRVDWRVGSLVGDAYRSNQCFNDITYKPYNLGLYLIRDQHPLRCKFYYINRIFDMKIRSNHLVLI